MSAQTARVDQNRSHHGKVSTKPKLKASSIGVSGVSLLKKAYTTTLKKIMKQSARGVLSSFAKTSKLIKLSAKKSVALHLFRVFAALNSRPFSQQKMADLGKKFGAGLSKVLSSSQAEEVKSFIKELDDAVQNNSEQLSEFGLDGLENEQYQNFSKFLEEVLSAMEEEKGNGGGDSAAQLGAQQPMGGGGGGTMMSPYMQDPLSHNGSKKIEEVDWLGEEDEKDTDIESKISNEDPNEELDNLNTRTNPEAESEMPSPAATSTPVNKASGQGNSQGNPIVEESYSSNSDSSMDYSSNDYTRNGSFESTPQRTPARDSQNWGAESSPFTDLNSTLSEPSPLTPKRKTIFDIIKLYDFGSDIPLPPKDEIIEALDDELEALKNKENDEAIELLKAELEALKALLEEQGFDQEELKSRLKAYRLKKIEFSSINTQTEPTDLSELKRDVDDFILINLTIEDKPEANDRALVLSSNAALNKSLERRVKEAQALVGLTDTETVFLSTLMAHLSAAYLTYTNRNKAILALKHNVEVLTEENQQALEAAKKAKPADTLHRNLEVDITGFRRDLVQVTTAITTGISETIKEQKEGPNIDEQFADLEAKTSEFESILPNEDNQIEFEAWLKARLGFTQDELVLTEEELTACRAELKNAKDQIKELNAELNAIKEALKAQVATTKEMSTANKALEKELDGKSKEHLEDKTRSKELLKMAELRGEVQNFLVILLTNDKVDQEENESLKRKNQENITLQKSLLRRIKDASNNTKDEEQIKFLTALSEYLISGFNAYLSKSTQVIDLNLKIIRNNQNAIEATKEAAKKSKPSDSVHRNLEGNITGLRRNLVRVTTEVTTEISEIGMDPQKDPDVDATFRNVEREINEFESSFPKDNETEEFQEWLNARFEFTKNELKLTEEELAACREELKNAKAQIKELKDELKATKKALKTQIAATKKMNIANEELKKAMNAAEENNQRIISRKDQQLEDAESEIEGLTAKVKRAKRDSEFKDDALKELESTSKALQAKLEKMKADKENQSSEEDIKELNRLIKDKNRQLQLLKDQLQVSEEATTTAEKAASTFYKKMKSRFEDIEADQVEKIKGLKEKQVELKVRLQDTTDQFEKAQLKVVELENQIDVYEAESEGKKLKAEALKSKLQEKNDEIARLEKQIDGLKSDLRVSDKLRKDEVFQALEDKIAMTQVNANLMRENAGLKIKSEKLAEDSANQQALIDCLVTTLDNARAERDQAKKLNQELDKELEIWDQENRDLHQSIKPLKEEIKALNLLIEKMPHQPTQQIQSDPAPAAQDTKAIGELEEKLSNLQKDKLALEEKLLAQESRITELRRAAQKPATTIIAIQTEEQEPEPPATATQSTETEAIQTHSIETQTITPMIPLEELDISEAGRLAARKDIENLLLELAELNNKANATENERDSWKEKCEEISNQSKKLAESLQRAMGAIKKLAPKNAQLKSELERSNELIKMLRAEIQELESKRKDGDETIQNLKERVDELQTTISNLRKELESAQTENATLEQKYQEALKKYDSEKAHTHQLEEELEAEKAKIRELGQKQKEKIRKLEREIQSLNKDQEIELQELKQRYNDRLTRFEQQEQEVRDKLITALKTDFEKEKQDLEEEHTEIKKELNTQIQGLKALLQASKNREEKTFKELQELESEFQTHRDEARQKKAINYEKLGKLEIKYRLAVEQKKLEKQDEESAKTDSEFGTPARKARKLNTQKGKHQTQLVINALKEKLAKLEEKSNEKLKSEHAKREVERSEEENRVKTLKSQKESLMRDHILLREHAATQAEQLRAANQEMQKLLNQMPKETEGTKWKEEYEEKLQRFEAQSTQTIRELTMQALQLESDYESLEASNQQKDKKIKDLELKLAGARKELLSKMGKSSITKSQLDSQQAKTMAQAKKILSRLRTASSKASVTENKSPKKQIPQAATPKDKENIPLSPFTPKRTSSLPTTPKSDAHQKRRRSGLSRVSVNGRNSIR